MKNQFRILLFLASAAAATWQVEAKSWRGIEPLQSTRADVIRLFNKCDDEVRICSFELEHEVVSIHFAGALRTDISRYRCVKDLQPGIVLRIEVDPKGSVRFKRKDFAQSRFKSFDPSARKTRNYKAYLDRDSGILINTREGKIVETIYLASSSDSRLCQSDSRR